MREQNYRTGVSDASHDISMDQKPISQWLGYWWLAWRERPPAKLFSIWRAIPAILVSAAQFGWKHKAHTPFSEMWIAIAIIIAVYVGLSFFDGVLRWVLISPVNLHSRQSEIIKNLTAGKESLPSVSAQEQRKRQEIARQLENFTNGEKSVLRYILDHGEVGRQNIAGSGFDLDTFERATNKGVAASLLVRRQTEQLTQAENRRWYTTFSINPKLESPLKFILESDSGNTCS